MPKKGTKLSSAQKKSRARKAAVTRCQNKCVATGGQRAKRKSMSASKKAAAAARLRPWLDFLAQWRADHPNVKVDVMKKAGSAYRRLPKA